MKVILRQDVKGIGRRGERKDVADGHARNYLIPRGLAVAATGQALQLDGERKAREVARSRRAEREVRALAAELDGKTVTVAAKVSAGGTLYAAVGPVQVAAALAHLCRGFGGQGTPVTAEMVSMPPAKKPGTAEAVITFKAGVSARVFVHVMPVSQEARKPV